MLKLILYIYMTFHETLTVVLLILNSELAYFNGIILGLLSALFSTLFAVINGRFIERYNATVISFYSLLIRSSKNSIRKKNI